VVLTLGDRVFDVPAWVSIPISVIGYAVIGLVMIPIMVALILIDLLPR